MRVKLLIAAGLMLCALADGTQAIAAGYPERPITLIVPYPAGGIVDATGRILARALSEKIGREVIVENRAGAGGVIGMNAMMRAQKDGYTIGLVNRPLLVFRSAMDPSYNVLPGKDYTAIALAYDVPLVFATRPGEPFHTIGELIAYARKNPGTIPFGSAGIATSSHLSVELLEMIEGVKFKHIPYQGEAPTIVELLGGRVKFIVANTAVKEQVTAGKLVALATTGNKRWGLFPDIPTVEEAGVKGYSFTSWVAVAGPPGLPDEAVVKLTKALTETIAAPEIKTAYEAMGLAENPMVGSELSKYVEDDIVSFKKVVDANGLKMK